MHGILCDLCLIIIAIWLIDDQIKKFHTKEKENYNIKWSVYQVCWSRQANINKKEKKNHLERQKIEKNIKRIQLIYKYTQKKKFLLRKYSIFSATVCFRVDNWIVVHCTHKYTTIMGLPRNWIIFAIIYLCIIGGKCIHWNLPFDIEWIVWVPSENEPKQRNSISIECAVC